MLDPYITKRIRQAHVEVVGRTWGGFKGARSYLLTDDHLQQLGDNFTRENVSKVIKPLTGDFEYITDLRAIVGESELTWEDEDNELSFNFIDLNDDE